jgi:endo-1,4-beta-xylanase
MKQRCWYAAAVVIILVSGSLSFAQQAPQAAAPQTAPVPSLAQTLAPYFPVGAAITPADLAGPHAELLKRHFNSIVAENDMKWARIHPGESTYDFSRADALVAFARANHMLIRGHNLLWHKQNPAWLFKDANGNELQPTAQNKALLLARLEKHIRAIAGRYRDDVYAWDVVNEVIDPSQPDGMRRTPWYLLTGTDYIDTAFRIAREVAPKAKLFINDYDTTDPVKRQFLFNLVRDLKRRGVPVDGVGHQMHINIDCPSVADFVETVNMFAQLGVDQQVTELDMSVYHDRDDSYPRAYPVALDKQAVRYRELFDALRGLKGKISGVTFWGVADDHTWLTHFPATRADWPLLFDAQANAKPAFWGIVDPARLTAPANPGSNSGQ